MVLLSKNFYRDPRDISQGSVPQLTPFSIHTWLIRCNELSASLQVTPNWGGRAVKVLEDFAVHRNIQNGLPEAAQGQSCIWEGTISGQVSRQLNAHWIAALRAQAASSLLSCFTWDTMSNFGMPPAQERC